LIYFREKTLWKIILGYFIQSFNEKISRLCNVTPIFSLSVLILHGPALFISLPNSCTQFGGPYFLFEESFAETCVIFFCQCSVRLQDNVSDSVLTDQTFCGFVLVLNIRAWRQRRQWKRSLLISSLKVMVKEAAELVTS